MKLRTSTMLWAAWTFLGSAPAQSQELPSQALSVLQRRCLQCHNESTAMSGLQMLTREQLLKGGSRGPSIKPGDASGSLLFQVVSQAGKLVMPPAGKLTEDETRILRTWIDRGAVWPASVKQAAQSDWWAFCKPLRPKVPGPAGAHPVDAFLTEKLKAAGIEPAAEADRLTLLRRACFDLHGLPPTPEQVKGFLNDGAPGAWERLIDSLLESPRYGEKWGRHWLDLVRYGDTSGFEQDPYTLEAWRYRDYVIKSLNDDKPYDKFVKEQIAGDELWPDDPEARTGTGYFRVGANRDMLFKVEELNAVEKLTDAVDTTSTVFLGLTTGCARCHDHKFDPIPQRDFYRMQAIFAPAVNDRVFLEYNMARFYDIAANSREFKLRQIGESIDRIQKPYREKSRQEKIVRLSSQAQAAIAIPAEKRTPEQQALVTESEATLKVSDDEIRAALTPADAAKLQQIEKRLGLDVCELCTSTHGARNYRFGSRSSANVHCRARQSRRTWRGSEAWLSQCAGWRRHFRPAAPCQVDGAAQGIGRVAGEHRESIVWARDDEPRLAVSFRARTPEDPQRFWSPRRSAFSS